MNAFSGFGVLQERLVAGALSAHEAIPDALKGFGLDSSTLPKDATVVQYDATQTVKAIAQLRDATQSVRFADLREPRRLADVYIPLYGISVPVKIDEAKGTSPFDLASHLASAARPYKAIVLLGGPGSGKTTVVRAIASEQLSHLENGDDFFVPLLVNLREMASSKSRTSLLKELQRHLPLKFSWPDSIASCLQADQLTQLETSVYLHYLDALRPLVVLDGLDEVWPADLRSSVETEFFQLAGQLRNSRVILTCRSGEWRRFLPEVEYIEIAPLNTAQVHNFASRWLATSEGADSFLAQLQNSPFFDTAIRPLTLAHLTAIYLRVGSLPERPKSVYRKVVHLLLEEWDLQRQVSRTSSYANFDSDTKLDFLSNLAFELTVTERSYRYDREQLARAFQAVAPSFSLPAWEATSIARELETHTGIFVETGRGQFEFSHKSLQEFLVANFVIRLPSASTLGAAAALLPNELAIAVALSSTPAKYLQDLSLGVFPHLQVPDYFAEAFLSRLALEKPDFGRAGEELVISSFFLSAIGATRESLGRLFAPSSPSDVLTCLDRHFTLNLRSDGLALQARKGSRLRNTPYFYLVPHARLQIPQEALATLSNLSGRAVR